MDRIVLIPTWTEADPRRAGYRPGDAAERTGETRLNSADPHLTGGSPGTGGEIQGVPRCAGRPRRAILDDMSGTTNATSSKTPGPGGFEETIKDFWASRPRRPLAGRKAAGVAAAVGNRYGIDPVIVRVALVAATVLGGVGASLYILGWLFFPDERDEVSAGEALLGKGHSSVSKGFALVLAFALFPTFGWTFGGGWFDGGGYVALGLLITGLYLLHRSRGHANRPIAPSAPAYGTFSAAPMSAPFTGTDPASGAPAWDPLGAAPFAWDLPDPDPAPAPPPPPAPVVKRRRSAIAGAAFGLALVTAGTGVALAFTGVPWFTPAHIVGLALGVLGVGMVAASFAGGGRGLIGLAAPLGLLGVALTVVNPVVVGGGVGDLSVTPQSSGQVNREYQKSVGAIDLDLTKIPNDGTVIDTTVRVMTGDATVIIPENADVTFTCVSRIGDMSCLTQGRDGIANAPISGEDFGADGPGGQRFNVAVDTSVGSAAVIRRG